MANSKFLSTENRGFQLTFNNGWTISVQYGNGNYCSNRNVETKDEMFVESVTAEIAIWDANKKDYDFGDRQLCLGWLTTDEVADWIEKVKKF